MSIATFESPQVASQQFFPWVFDEEVDCGYSDSEMVQECESEPVCESQPAPCVARPMNVASEARIGKPVRLGSVMIKLLKSYGITDEEIAEGMAAYAAKTGLAQAG